MRQPFFSPIPLPRSHSRVATLCTALSMAFTVRTASFAAACLRITRRCASALRAYPSYGPTTPASSADRRYAVPVMTEVMDAASARPPSES